jgi:hypothetical protein
MTAVKLDQNGLNTAISASVLPEGDMRRLGFTDHKADTWYQCFPLQTGVTLNISIPKNGSRFRLDVLDEDFGQPYDYQRHLEHNPNLEFAQKVKARVEFQLELLSKAGVIHGFTRSMYL